MKHLRTVEEFDYYLFKPSIFSLFHENLQEMYFKRWVRFAISSLRGSVIYYMLRGGKTVGYCQLEPGGWRYAFAEKSDVIISPYVIASDERGKGLGKLLIETVVNELYGGGRVWATVERDNIPSIKTLKKAGFLHCANACICGVLRKYVVSEDTNARYLVFRKDKPLKSEGL